MNNITILILVDAIGALASQTLDNNLYLVDDNKLNGSENLGTGNLLTAVKKGDKVIWTVMAFEPESFSSLTGITIDSAYCKPERKTYPGTDVSYMEGVILKDIPRSKQISYEMNFDIGNPTLKLEAQHEHPGFINSKV